MYQRKNTNFKKSKILFLSEKIIRNEFKVNLFKFKLTKEQSQ